MKRRFLLTGVMALLCLFTPRAMAQSYELRVLTFEDVDVPSAFAASTYTGDATVWSDLIPASDDQGAPAILYADGYGADYSYYWWHDGGNTELFAELNEGWGSYCYWSGGEAVSNIWTSDYETYNSYTSQFTAYRPGLTDNNLNTSGGGHNGSDNFCVHFGYIDNSGYGLNNVGAISFADGVARVIDHVYICPTTYTYYCITSGNSLTDALGADGRIIIRARGFASASDAEPSATLDFVFFDGQGTATLDWTKWDLYDLGAIEKLEFTMFGEGLGATNGYGLSQPAYFAWDDMAVRFPVAAPTSYERDVTVGRYGTICLPYAVGANNRSGATFYNVVAKTSEGIILEEETGDLTAGKAYIFYATATSLECTYSGEAVTTPISAASNNGLQGTFEDNTVVPTGLCFLYENKLRQADGTSHKVNANRAYLDDTYVPDYVPAPVPGRRRVVIGRAAEEATGIDAVEENGQNGRKEMINGVMYIHRNGRLYNAQGQEVK